MMQPTGHPLWLSVGFFLLPLPVLACLFEHINYRNKKFLSNLVTPNTSCVYRCWASLVSCHPFDIAGVMSAVFFIRGSGFEDKNRHSSTLLIQKWSCYHWISFTSVMCAPCSLCTQQKDDIVAQMPWMCIRKRVILLISPQQKCLGLHVKISEAFFSRWEVGRTNASLHHSFLGRRGY